jgi:hypothetical protein
MCKKYDAKIVRDISKFSTPTYDRITLLRANYRGLQSEMAANY